MIPFKVTINKEVKSINIPTSWEDVTFDQYCALLRSTGNLADILPIFTGLDKDVILKAKIQGLDQLLAAIDFTKEKPVFDKTPEDILGTKLLKDITYEALAPYIDSKDILDGLKDSVPDFTEAYAKYIAIYVQAVRDGWEGYDYEKAMLLVPEVMKLPAWEVVGVGAFFIIKLLRLKKDTVKAFRKADTPPKKSKRGTKS